MGRRLKVFYLAVDPATPLDQRPRAGLMQGREIAIDAGEQLGDGPCCSRVAVEDRDPVTGELAPGARLMPDGPARAMATHAVADRSDIFARDFQQVSVFGAMHATMALFEGPGVLGRRLRWAFDTPQIKVVPRAGEKANAQYDRGRESLEFFYFDGIIGGQETRVYTCLSPDIVSHETAHAVLDGIAPDLYNATAPQSLGLHEAIADITALIFAASSPRLKLIVLDQNRGDLRQPGAFNAIAEQFGRARSGRIQPLRDLLNSKRIADVAATPHALSEVLSGALYEMFLFCYERELTEAVEEIGDTPENRYTKSGFVLASVSKRFARIALRALDYLPPGEVSFADYVRAVVAADTASNPASPLERDFLAEKAVRRGILAEAADAAPMECAIDMSDTDLDALMQDDAAARRFAEAHRDALHIPPGVAFEVRPRLDVTKRTIRRGNVPYAMRELIFKVSWASRERGFDAAGIPSLAIRQGTTLAIRWEDKQPNALLTTNPAAAPFADRSDHQGSRSSWLAANLADGTLSLARDAEKVAEDCYRFRGTMRQLHLAGRGV